jgi:hypothetical protein
MKKTKSPAAGRISTPAINAASAAVINGAAPSIGAALDQKNVEDRRRQLLEEQKAIEAALGIAPADPVLQRRRAEIGRELEMIAPESVGCIERGVLRVLESDGRIAAEEKEAADRLAEIQHRRRVLHNEALKLVHTRDNLVNNRDSLREQSKLLTAHVLRLREKREKCVADVKRAIASLARGQPQPVFGSGLDSARWIAGFDVYLVLTVEAADATAAALVQAEKRYAEFMALHEKDLELVDLDAAGGAGEEKGSK